MALELAVRLSAFPGDELRGFPPAFYPQRTFSASLEQIQYHLYVVQKIEAGLRDAEEGRLLSQEEVERRIAKWPDR